MKKLTIVAEVPDGFANELERGTGNLAAWAQDALRQHWEGEWVEAGEWGRGKEGFRVVEARIGREAAPANLVVRGRKFPQAFFDHGCTGYLGNDFSAYEYGSDGCVAACAFEKCGSSDKAIEDLLAELPRSRELEGMYGTFVGYWRPWEIAGGIAFLLRHGMEFDRAAALSEEISHPVAKEA